MTTVLLPENDPRGAKAVAIAADSGQWLKCRDNYGRKLYGIRSSQDSDQVYFVTRTSCTCYDARRRTCKHQLAVQLHCELMAEEAARESVGADNVAHLDLTLAAVRTAAAQVDLGRILNPKPAAWARPQRGVIPASQIERED